MSTAHELRDAVRFLVEQIPGPRLVEHDPITPYTVMLHAAITELAAARRTTTLHAAITELAEARELLDSAWGVIANANARVALGDWEAANTLWREAAERWRDRYFAMLKAAQAMKGSP
jgi:hypothetical protein